MRLPSASLPPGPVSSQAPAYNLLLQFMRLHQYQVASAGLDSDLLRPPHVLLSGMRGCGKSHIARLAAVAATVPVANQLSARRTAAAASTRPKP